MNNKGKPIKLSSEAPKNASVKIKFSDKIRSAQLDKQVLDLLILDATRANYLM